MRALTLDDRGWLLEARRIDSPNCDQRADPADVSLVVVHAISLPPREYGGEGVQALFTNRLDPAAHPYYRHIHELKVSAHFFIRRTGELIQFVSCRERAWHAGPSTWKGRARCNDYSIGVELEGSDYDPFEMAQYEVLNALIETLRQAYPIADVVGHSDVAPGRKTDPGPFFDWTCVPQRQDPA